ncbi:ABC transporter ATP-binding protein [Kineococcus rubinsiae]|uniref:ABC transporter ATP-binding protein n=1 Tax=Kineococcus rubinsiae TaxID=2609562 RepID=UPI00143209BF|nr:ATP-binding cassette domain-containing protein [Kineococcus rubinsiae]NIZ89705.1 ATP-binding cassette domain-containing protein [Kineococcus rubinsiae]
MTSEPTTAERAVAAPRAGWAVRAEGLTKRYGTLTAVDGISVHVAEGEVHGMLGPNGAGKTTFLRMLFGLVRPDAGVLEVLGRSWSRDGNATLDGVAGFLESPRFYPYLSGRRNLQLLAGLDGGTAPGRVEEVLDVVDLTGRETEAVAGYSFGMRQRLGVAASLLRDPRLLVLDEPANGLDPAGIRDMRALVARLAASGLTVLLSSHDMDEVEQVCDDVTIMKRGSVAHHGPIAELRRQAPPQAHLLRTSDDTRALELAQGRPGLEVARAGAELAVRGTQGAVDLYVSVVVRAGLAVRSLTLGEAPLEALFFLLTEPAPAEGPPAGPDGQEVHP